MSKFYEEIMEEVEIRDVVTGIVTGGCSKGIFIRLENGQYAFARFGGLSQGTEVLCTVLKKDTDKRYMLVGIDSVLKVAIPSSIAA